MGTIVLVGVDSDGEGAGFATLSEEHWEQWSNGMALTDIPDVWGLFYGEDTPVTLHDDWDSVVLYAASIGDTIKDVVAAISY